MPAEAKVGLLFILALLSMLLLPKEEPSTPVEEAMSARSAGILVNTEDLR